MSGHAVITGVSRGLGRALAEGLVSRGWLVSGCARSPTDFPGVDFQAVDVTSASVVQAWAEGVVQRVGPPDLLVNNAAIINRNAPLWEVPASEFARVVDVNIKGTANVCRAFLPHMLARGSGIVVNMSSGWGRSASRDVAPYCATKWAVEGLTKALAAELPDGLAAASLSPGAVDTDMLRSCLAAAAGGFPKPQEWAELAVPFLLGLTPECNGKQLSVQ